jgi:acetoacetyl-CoA synthetase
VIGRFKWDVLDCIVVGRRRPGDSDEVVVMFLKLTPDLTRTPSLLTSIRKSTGTSLSPRHIPKFILQVRDVPYTANGKKVENAVKVIVSGQSLVASGMVVNPEFLDEYRQFVDLGGASRMSAKI